MSEFYCNCPQCKEVNNLVDFKKYGKCFIGMRPTINYFIPVQTEKAQMVNYYKGSMMEGIILKKAFIFCSCGFEGLSKVYQKKEIVLRPRGTGKVNEVIKKFLMAPIRDEDDGLL